MFRSRIVVAAVAFVAFIAMAASAWAELPPGAYEKMLANAPEVLKIKVTKVELQDPDGTSSPQDIIYTAKVTGVVRSESERKVGDTIRVGSVRQRPGSPPLFGGVLPPLLEVDWTGTAYLKFIDRELPYRLAAAGRSFAPDE